MNFAQLWNSLIPIGRTYGGYRRFTWSPADAECRQWFIEQARLRDLDVVVDRNGNIWAWWDVAGGVRAGGYLRQHSSKAGGDTRSAVRRGAVVTGSHLDSVPDGGAFDGALGVVSGLAAVDLLRERDATPGVPVGVTVFVEEEGARFGVACLGSRLLTGVVEADRARALTDDSGVTYEDAMRSAGLDPGGIGPDEDLLGCIGAFVELHIEQGRALEPLGEPIGLVEGIWPHGRWRFDFVGRADHAGTARFADRRDPMLPYAATVLAARQVAGERGALATFGKVIAEPGGVNGVPGAVHAWLDARAPAEERLADTVTTVRSIASRVSAEHGITVGVRQESATPAVLFDQALTDRIKNVLGDVPVLPTGAGHDAGVLAARVPTAMVFVRNPTGVSHSPEEHAEMADCEAGVRALAAVLEELACK